MDKLPARLPLKRPVDHMIKVGKGKKRLDRPIFQLSPAKLLPTKKCLMASLSQRRTQPNRSFYGASHFIVVNKKKWCKSIDYKILDYITKSNNTPIFCTCDMLDGLD